DADGASHHTTGVPCPEGAARHPHHRRRRFPLQRDCTTSRLSAFAVVLALVTLMTPFTASSTTAQSTLSCEPIPQATPASPIPDSIEIPAFDIPEDAIDVTIGYTPISIYAPMFLAYEK